MSSNHESEGMVYPNSIQAEPNLMGAPIDPLWTVEDVADYFKLQPETIRSMARRGELPALKIGKVWRFQRRAIHEMLIRRA